ncbi:MAG: TatD family hydrolase, partial [Treponema sp.]|nr:TatD family hydrolase [Treponema sp.]
PSAEEIKNRKENIDILNEQIKEGESSSQNDFPFNTKIIALGECGLDHHWNPSGEDHRNAEDFSTDMFRSEKELFEMQLLLAKDLSLPVIIHSRDAFKETLESVKKIDYHNGIIHCYSYGKTEAKEFLDYGWYISFSGSITYTKKRCMNEMEELIKSIPYDRILVETDSPYLAPVPFRGKVNSPSLIKNTYDFIAKIKGISSEELSALVDKNISKLFNITKPDCKEN